MKNNLNIKDTFELQNEVISYFEKDIERFSTGLLPADEFYHVLKGNCTDITGYPYSGKTLLLLEILFNLSVKYGFKHLLHLPDSGKPAEVIANLIHKKTGKSFNQNHPNAIREDEIIKAFTWIGEHFKILQYGKRPTPIEFWEYSATLDVQTAAIDSWNYMRHLGSGTDYLAEMLSARNELAEKHNKHFFTIIHPRNPTQTDYDKNGVIKAPDVFNLMGGSEWNNNGKNIIVVHKDAKEGDNYDIYFRKIKPRQVGKTGFINLKFDIFRQKFYDDMLNYKRYANENAIRTKEEQEADNYFGAPINIDL
jgi:hypothetical protein